MKELNQSEPRTYFIVKIFKSFEVFSWEQGRASNYTCWKEKRPREPNPLHDLGKSLVTLLGLLLPSHQTQCASPLCSNPLRLIKYVALQETEAPQNRLIRFSDSQYKNLWKKCIALLYDWSANWLVVCSFTHNLQTFQISTGIIRGFDDHSGVHWHWCGIVRLGSFCLPLGQGRGKQTETLPCVHKAFSKLLIISVLNLQMSSITHDRGSHRTSTITGIQPAFVY